MIRRVLTAAGVVAISALFPGGVDAQSAPSISLMHGIPGATVDVVVDGEVVVPGFEPGTMQDISAFAGQTLTNVEVRAAGTEDVVIGPIAELAVPASGNFTVIAHLDADGAPTLTPFENDVSRAGRGPGSPDGAPHRRGARRRHRVGRRLASVHEPVEPEPGIRRPSRR